MGYFKVDTVKNIGENWLIANFGLDEDGEQYIVTTNHIHASEYWEISLGAKGDAFLVCELLNQHYKRMFSDHYYRDRFTKQINEMLTTPASGGKGEGE